MYFFSKLCSFNLQYTYLFLQLTHFSKPSRSIYTWTFFPPEKPDSILHVRTKVPLTCIILHNVSLQITTCHVFKRWLSPLWSELTCEGNAFNATLLHKPINPGWSVYRRPPRLFILHLSQHTGSAGNCLCTVQTRRVLRQRTKWWWVRASITVKKSSSYWRHFFYFTCVGFKKFGSTLSNRQHQTKPGFFQMD